MIAFQKPISRKYISIYIVTKKCPFAKQRFVNSLLVVACMQFTFTKTYPDEIPLIEVARSDGIEENDEQELLNHLREEVFLSNFDIKQILALGIHSSSYSTT